MGGLWGSPPVYVNNEKWDTSKKDLPEPEPKTKLQLRKIISPAICEKLQQNGCNVDEIKIIITIKERV